MDLNSKYNVTLPTWVFGLPSYLSFTSCGDKSLALGNFFRIKEVAGRVTLPQLWTSMNSIHNFTYLSLWIQATLCNYLSFTSRVDKSFAVGIFLRIKEGRCRVTLPQLWNSMKKNPLLYPPGPLVPGNLSLGNCLSLTSHVDKGYCHRDFFSELKLGGIRVTLVQLWTSIKKNP